jgi:hypothetical protein
MTRLRCIPGCMLSLALAGLLSGCVSHGISLPKGIYLPDGCGYGVLQQSEPARCMTRSEYKAAKEKLRHSQDKPATEEDKKVDPRYKDWIP